jgi:serine-type D-Ala-D-Ala carboxypeptidase/endopeptidase (penicillin-binding protein 4)
MKAERSTRVFLSGVALCAGALALSPPIEAKGPGRLAREIETILKREVFAPAIVAIDIRDLGTGLVLYERNATLNVKPASTMKLFTTAAILDAEGPEGTAGATTVETAGRLDSLGRVLGDLYLIGRGDPNLSDRFSWRSEKGPFDQLAKDIRDAGITRIEGGLVGYDGLFSDEAVPDNWTADDLVWSYGAAVTALSAFDSSLGLRVEPGERDGDAARLFVKPETGFMRFDNRVVTAGEGKPRITLKRELGSRVVMMEGSIPRLAAAWTGAIAAPEPTLFATTLLSEALARQGVSLRDAPRASRNPLPDGLRPLASLRGPSVAEQIRVVNKESQNLHAETLL